MIINPPVVIEVPIEDRTIWLLSFGGSNPEEDECIELTKTQCFWMEDKIMSIDPSLFERARRLSSAPNE